MVRVFPPEVHQSLAGLRELSKRVKSRQEWEAVGRWATPDEIALGASQRLPWHCAGSSTRHGLPCTKARVAGMTVCRKHGGNTQHVRRAATRRLETMVAPVLGRMKDLAMQDEHKPTAYNASRDILDRACIGAPIEAKVRQSADGGKPRSDKAQLHVGFMSIVTGRTDFHIVSEGQNHVTTSGNLPEGKTPAEALAALDAEVIPNQ